MIVALSPNLNKQSTNKPRITLNPRPKIQIEQTIVSNLEDNKTPSNKLLKQSLTNVIPSTFEKVDASPNKMAKHSQSLKRIDSNMSSIIELLPQKSAFSD